MRKLVKKSLLLILSLLILLAVGSVAAYADEQCICETKCTEVNLNENCPVCSTDNADITAVCQGAGPMLLNTRSEDPAINIGNTEIKAGKYYVNTSTGGVTESGANAKNYNVYYDSSSNTLRLRNAKITANSIQRLTDSTGALIDTWIYHAFYTDGGTLTIRLEGNNEFTGAALPSERNYRTSCGILFNKTDVTITGSGNLTATGGDSRNSTDEMPESFGLYVMDGDLTIDCTGELTLMGDPAKGETACSAGIRINSIVEKKLFKIVSGNIICGSQNNTDAYCCDGIGISSYCEGNGTVDFEMHGGSIVTEIEGEYGYCYGISLTAKNNNCTAKIYDGVIKSYAPTGSANSIGAKIDNLEIYGGDIEFIAEGNNAAESFYHSRGLMAESILIKGGNVYIQSKDVIGDKSKNLTNYGVYSESADSYIQTGGNVTVISGKANSNSGFYFLSGGSCSLNGGILTVQSQGSCVNSTSTKFNLDNGAIFFTDATDYSTLNTNLVKGLYVKKDGTNITADIYGNEANITEDFTIPAVELIIDENEKLTVKNEANVNNQGTIHVIGALDGTIENIDSGKIIYYPKSIALNESELSIMPGQTGELSVTFNPENTTDKNLTWTVEDDSKAQIVSSSSTGATIKGSSVGETKVKVETTANLNEEKRTAECTIKILQPVTNITIDSSLQINVDESKTIQATVEPSDAHNKTLKWESSDTSVATVDSATGEVTGKSRGTVTITATANDGQGANATCQVEVKQQVTSINLTDIEINVGKTKKIEAEVSPDNANDPTLKWESSDTSVATVDSETGEVTGISRGTVTITATANDGQGAKATCQVEVKQQVTSIELNETEITLYVRDEETLEAKISPDNANDPSVTWSSSDPEVATVDQEGKVKGISKGEAVITATANDGSGVKAECKVTVKNRSGIVPQKTLTFDTNGGSKISAITENYGKTIVLADYAPKRDGYKFLGWYKDKELTEKIEYAVLDYDMTVYAKWQKIEEAVDYDTLIVLTINGKTSIINGEAVKNDVAPLIVNSRTYTPARFVAEALGAKVVWSPSARTVTIMKDDINIVLAIDSNVAYVNGQKVQMDASAFIADGRTFTPARFVAENLGAKVEWNEEARTVTIVK